MTSGASTKSYLSFIGELKQVSFQLFFKSISVRYSGVARAPQAPRPRGGGPAGLKGPARGLPGRSSRRNPLARGPNKLFAGGGGRKSSLRYWFVSSWRLEGSEFHAFGPAYEKLRSPNLSFSFGVSYRKLLAERSLSRPGRSAVAVIMSAR